MRDAPAELTAALVGSRAGDRLAVTVSRGGDMVAPDAPVTRWSYTSDMTRAVRDQLTLTVVDEAGGAAPWAPADLWAPTGTTVDTAWLCPAAGAELAMEPLRVTDVAVDETWRSRRVVNRVVNGSPVFAPGVVLLSSATLDVTCQSPTIGAQKALFGAPQPVGVRSSMVGEIRRLLAPWCPVTAHPAFVDATIPAGYTHQGNPLAAVEELLKSVNGTHRMTAGVFEVLPGTPTWGPTHTISWGDEGTLVKVDRSLSIDDFPNMVIVTGSAAGGKPVGGSASIIGGPLDPTGIHGPVPLVYSNDALLTDEACAEVARAVLVSKNRGARVILPVSCLPDPTIQGHDVITLTHPLGALTGVVESLTLSGSDQGVDTMDLRVAVYLDDLANLRRTTL